MGRKAHEISNRDDIIDSRDVIARIEELEDEIEAAKESGQDVTDEIEELSILKHLANEGEGSPDWKHGETLIRESYFRDYAEQLADDLGLIPSNASWPSNCIDWEKAARELRYDYFHVDFGGVTYLIRA